MKLSNLRFFVASVFVLCLLLLQTASQAVVSIPGWVYSTGGFMQNGGSVSASVNVYDYGTYLTNGLYFNGASGLVKSLPTQVNYVIIGTACTEATLTGPGSITKGTSVINGQMWVHLWKGIVNGVNANWVQAELRSVDGNNTLLWATGSTWNPATTTTSTPMKLGSFIRLPR